MYGLGTERHGSRAEAGTGKYRKSMDGLGDSESRAKAGTGKYRKSMYGLGRFMGAGLKPALVKAGSPYMDWEKGRP